MLILSINGFNFRFRRKWWKRVNDNILIVDTEVLYGGYFNHEEFG